MEDVLEKMDPEKREKLINSALKEFGNNPFDKASTNVIVKEAGISKGLLYHYFNSKESLYNYLIDFFFRVTTKDMMEFLDTSSPDLLERIEVTVKGKMHYIQKYPWLMLFAKAFYRHHTMEEAKEMVSKYAPMLYQDFYTKGVDYSLFREDIDPMMAISSIQWTVEHIAEDFGMALTQNTEVSTDSVFKQVEAYMGMLRKVYYK